MSKQKKYLDMDSWRAAKSLGIDPGVPPVKPVQYHGEGVGMTAPPAPVHTPISLSLHGDPQEQRARQSRLAANRALAKAGVREGLAPTTRTARATDFEHWVPELPGQRLVRDSS